MSTQGKGLCAPGFITSEESEIQHLLYPMGPRNPFSNYPGKIMNSFQSLNGKRLSILSDVIALLRHLVLTILDFIGKIPCVSFMVSLFSSERN